MARDFDFKSRTVKRPPELQRRQSVARKPKVRQAKWWLVLAVIGLSLVGYAVYRQYSSPTITTNTDNSSQPDSTTAQTSQRIQVYNGGAGEDVAKQLVAKLIAAGYLASYVGPTLDSYQGAEIWYSPGNGELSKQIIKEITASKIVTHESQIATGYAIQIFLGGN
ncbi:MAG: LytR C-terminal domain-containing protein [Patescibacteria group bacterium]